MSALPERYFCVTVRIEEQNYASGSAMDQHPEVKYLNTADGSIAYQSFGAGLGCTVVVPGLLANIEAAWSRPELVKLFSSLAKFTRVVLLDKQGTGLSDPAPTSVEQLTEGRAKELGAAMDALGLERATLFGQADGSLAAITFAALNPSRVDALVLYAAWARLRRPEFPDGVPEFYIERRLKDIGEQWGNDACPYWLDRAVISLVHDAEWRKWLAHAQRLAASPPRAQSLCRAAMQADVRGLLPSIKARTLVLHGSDDQVVAAINAEDVARGIPGARLAVIQSPDHFPHTNVDEMAALIQEFLTGNRPQVREQRRVATIVFADVVASTSTAAVLGNQRWADVLERTQSGLRDQVMVNGGSVVDTAGDGMFALFESPRPAIRCAEAMLRFVRTLDLQARAGVHTGEVEIRGERAMGLAIHTAARIASLASAGEVMTSRTIKDLLAGSALKFTQRGVHTLQGVPDRWELYAVREPD